MEICVKIESPPGEAPKMYGRHFDHTDLLVSKVKLQCRWISWGRGTWNIVASRTLPVPDTSLRLRFLRFYLFFCKISLNITNLFSIYTVSRYLYKALFVSDVALFPLNSIQMYLKFLSRIEPFKVFFFAILAKVKTWNEMSLVWEKNTIRGKNWLR